MTSDVDGSDGFAKYWQWKLEQNKDCPALPLQDMPCKRTGKTDCAVTCGFYTEYSESLSKEPVLTQLAISQRWFCHNDSRKACKGNADYLKISW